MAAAPIFRILKIYSLPKGNNMLNYLISGISLGSVYAIIALGYTMVYGIAKMLNFAHGDVIMVGGYAAFCASSPIYVSSLTSPLDSFMKAIIRMIAKAMAKMTDEMIIISLLPRRCIIFSNHLLIASHPRLSNTISVSSERIILIKVLPASFLDHQQP